MRAIASAALFAAVLGWSLGAQAQEVSDGGAEVWDLSTPNAPRHWFTGLSCWDSAGEARLQRRVAFAASGIDVGCAYEGQDLSVTVYATFRPGDGPIAPMIAQTRAQMAGRYDGAAVVSDAQRTITTSAGDIAVDEYVLSINGRDTAQNRDMRGATGAWHADAGGWTLKVRISGYGRADPQALRLLAHALLGRAYNEMQTARACASAGRNAAPNLNITDEEGVQVQVGAGLFGVSLAEAIPADPAAARRAGFVCLGDVVVTRDNRIALSVMPLQPAQHDLEAATGLTILAVGEVHGGEAAPMVAIVDMSMNPFLVEGMRADRGHFVFGRNGDETAFYGALDHGAPRQTAAQLAAYAAAGGAALITVGRRAAD
ncbi:MAG TPA: hypothetical protein VEA80_12315 [Vitreimonas sp.]|uniref:hypothetical protein n=1 Tax=Vitreimonas sp. TaxID=3069702 RepID=UPI002D60B0AB|nr:hypothetical protein [Vitreimonas sp.]HYD88255.1 hypothetical protein [Vitreimonas sp.]